MTGQPLPTEYAEYYGDYVKHAPDENIIDALGKQLVDTLAVIRRIPEDKTTEHPDGKWSVREVIGHLCDCERIFSYRAYRFAHNDKNELAGFEQDDYVREGGANSRSGACAGIVNWSLAGPPMGGPELNVRGLKWPTVFIA